MKPVRSRNRAAYRAFTLLELLIVIAIVVILASMIIPTYHGHPRSNTVHCMNNLKQLSLGLVMWQEDHGALPWEVSTTNGGTLELIEQGQALPHFESITNYLKAPTIFTCPGDKERRARFDKEAKLTAGTLSYFVNVDAVTNSISAILAGDRQIRLDGQSIPPGLATVTSQSALSWAPGIHAKRTTSGNLAFMDGHVESAQDNLNQLFQRQGIVTTRLVVP